MAEKYTAFRSAFWVLFLYINLWAWAGSAAAFVGLAALTADPANWSASVANSVVGMSVGMAAAPVITTLALVPLILYYRTYAGPDSLKCTDIFGNFHAVRWASIRGFRPVNMGGLRYLRLKSDEAERELWLPLFLADPQGFTELVAESAGEEHPLTLELRRRFPPPGDDDSSHGASA